VKVPVRAAAVVAAGLLVLCASERGRASHSLEALVREGKYQNVWRFVADRALTSLRIS
jgi:hypothetical protein